MEKLNSDIIYEITKHLTINDIYSMSQTSKYLKHAIVEYSSYILTDELKKHKNNNLTKEHIYSYVEKYIYNLFFYTNATYIKTILTIGNSSMTVRFRCIFDYLTNGIYNYPNQIDIYLLYLYLYLWFETPLSNKEYYISFLNNSKDKNFTIGLRDNYYRRLHSSLGLTIDNSYNMSKHVVTIPALIKLAGIKAMDLNKAELFECCPICINTDISNLVLFKFNRENDDLLSYNYTHIKQFLKKKNINIYKKFLQEELYIINNLINYTDPFTHKNTWLNSRRSHRFLYKLMFETGYVTTTQRRNFIESIKQKQLRFLKLYFE